MADKLVIKKISEFPKVTDPTGCTFAGYKTGQGDIQIDFGNMTPLFGVSQSVGISTSKAPSENAVQEALKNKADKQIEDGSEVTYSKVTEPNEGDVLIHEDGKWVNSPNTYIKDNTGDLRYIPTMIDRLGQIHQALDRSTGKLINF